MHHKRNLLEDQIEAHLVAVPVRGAGCIPHGKQELQGQELHHFSVPVRVRVASALSVRRITSSRCCRPREGCGLHRRTIVVRDDVQMLPSPRGVRVASCNLNFDDGAKAPLPSPRGARAVSTAPLLYSTAGGTLLSPRGVRAVSALSVRRITSSRCCRPRGERGLHPQQYPNIYQRARKLPSP